MNKHTAGLAAAEGHAHALPVDTSTAKERQPAEPMPHDRSLDQREGLRAEIETIRSNHRHSGAFAKKHTAGPFETAA